MIGVRTVTDVRVPCFTIGEEEIYQETKDKISAPENNVFINNEKGRTQIRPALVEMCCKLSLEFLDQIHEE